LAEHVAEYEWRGEGDEAERSGVQALEQFATRLRGYHLAPASA
jgi:hypothetical protein